MNETVMLALVELRMTDRMAAAANHRLAQSVKADAQRHGTGKHGNRIRRQRMIPYMLQQVLGTFIRERAHEFNGSASEPELGSTQTGMKPSSLRPPEPIEPHVL